MAAQVLIGDFSVGNRAAIGRPLWLLPTLVTAFAVLLGSMVNCTTRTYGAATAVGLLTLATRFLLVRVFAFPQIQPEAWLPLLPPLVALDIVYGWRSRRHDPTVSAVLAAGAALPGSALALWMIPRWYGYLHFRSLDVAVSLLTGFVAALAGAWLGEMIGDALAGAGARREGAEADATNLRWVAPAVLTLWALAVVYLVTTAVPPRYTF